jgi:hypothetical protein
MVPKLSTRGKEGRMDKILKCVLIYNSKAIENTGTSYSRANAQQKNLS